MNRTFKNAQKVPEKGPLMATTRHRFVKRYPLHWFPSIALNRGLIKFAGNPKTGDLVAVRGWVRTNCCLKSDTTDAVKGTLSPLPFAIILESVTKVN